MRKLLYIEDMPCECMKWQCFWTCHVLLECHIHLLSANNEQVPVHMAFICLHKVVNPCALIHKAAMCQSLAIDKWLLNDRECHSAEQLSAWPNCVSAFFIITIHCNQLEPAAHIVSDETSHLDDREFCLVCCKILGNIWSSALSLFHSVVNNANLCRRMKWSNCSQGNCFWPS